MQAIFKKYDLRGIVGTEFQISDVYDITKAILTYFKNQNPNLNHIAVGMDGRISSLDIKDQVCQAILDSGLNAHFIGLCTTPIMYFACNTLPVDAGIMITASHNPKEYNGFKLILNKESVWGDQIEEIYQIYISKKFIPNYQAGNYYVHETVNSYIDDLVNRFSHLINADLKLVIDCGNGSAGVVIPKLIKKLNWTNTAILYPEVDGNYPNHEPNPVEEKNMLDVKNFLASHDCDFGIGFDGDCDRVGAMTKVGYLIPGDLLLGIFALNIKEQYDPVVVMDSKCSDIIAQTLEKNQIKCFVSPTGFAFIKSYLKLYDGIVGGELSGHFCFKDRHFGYDDGIYAMLRLCEILIQTKQTLESWINAFPKAYCSPEYRIACSPAQKELLLEETKKTCRFWKNVKISNLDGIRVQTEIGWFLVRAANTEPAISIRIEGYSPQDLQQLKLNLFEIISTQIDREQLASKMDI